MPLQISPDGPIEEYLRAAGRSRDEFDDLLRQEDPTALSLVMAEQLCDALDTLGRTIDVQRAAKPAGEQSGPTA